MVRKVCSSVKALLGVSFLLLIAGTNVLAQTPASDPPAQHTMAADASDQNKQLTDQISELRAQVAKLQAAVQQTGPGKKASPKSGMKMGSAANKGMGMTDDKSEMGMPPAQGAMTPGSPAMGMKDDEGEMGGMPPAGNAPMSPSMGDDQVEMGGMSPAPAPAMGMCCMGQLAPGGNSTMNSTPPAAGGTASMNGPSSAIPGQPGASHLYHIGSNGFFLNHSRHITLTADQKLALNRVKEKAMFDRGSEQRRIDQGEQELYTLTGSDQPDNTKIQAKIVEIEKLRADQRMNFIRAVSQASNVLTPEQRKALLGKMPATRS